MQLHPAAAALLERGDVPEPVARALASDDVYLDALAANPTLPTPVRVQLAQRRPARDTAIRLVWRQPPEPDVSRAAVTAALLADERRSSVLRAAAADLTFADAYTSLSDHGLPHPRWPTGDANAAVLTHLSDPVVADLLVAHADLTVVLHWVCVHQHRLAVDEAVTTLLASARRAPSGQQPTPVELRILCGLPRWRSFPAALCEAAGDAADTAALAWIVHVLASGPLDDTSSATLTQRALTSNLHADRLLTDRLLANPSLAPADADRLRRARPNATAAGSDRREVHLGDLAAANDVRALALELAANIAHDPTAAGLLTATASNPTLPPAVRDEVAATFDGLDDETVERRFGQAFEAVRDAWQRPADQAYDRLGPLVHVAAARDGDPRLLAGRSYGRFGPRTSRYYPGDWRELGVAELAETGRWSPTRWNTIADLLPPGSLTGVLGTDLRAWQVALALAPEWAGTLGELTDTAAALARGPDEVPGC